MNYIFEEEGWRNFYRENPDCRKNTWIYIKFNDNSVVFLREMKQWLTIQKYCSQKDLTMKQVGLQYKSHREVIDCLGCDGIYVVTSIRGQMGGEPKHCFTIGKVRGDKIKKDLWITPELIIEDSYEDSIDTCFKEAIVYHDPEAKIIQ